MVAGIGRGVRKGDLERNETKWGRGKEEEAEGRSSFISAVSPSGKEIKQSGRNGPSFDCWKSGTKWIDRAKELRETQPSFAVKKKEAHWGKKKKTAHRSWQRDSELSRVPGTG